MSKKAKKRRSRRAPLILGGFHEYRRPVFDTGKWRVRRRNLLTGRKEKLTLDAESWTEACREVEELAEKERQEIEEAKKSPEEKTLTEIDLETALEEWLRTLDVRDSTLKEYRYCTRVYRDSLGASRSVFEIQLAELEGLFHTDWKEDRKGRTKIKHLAMLKRFFAWCVKRGYCRDNPAEKIEVPRKWSREQIHAKETTGKALTLEDARKLLKVCKEPVIVELENAKGKWTQDYGEPPQYLHLFVLIALRTGLRAGNICGENGIRWSDIDWKEKTLSIDGGRMKNHLALNVSLHPEVLKALESEKKKLKTPPTKEQKVFPVDSVRKALTGAVKRAGLDIRPQHDLRHTFATWIGEIAPELVAARLLGHAKGSVTDRYAGRHHLDTLRTWIEKLEWLELGGE